MSNFIDAILELKVKKFLKEPVPYIEIPLYPVRNLEKFMPSYFLKKTKVDKDGIFEYVFFNHKNESKIIYEGSLYKGSCLLIYKKS